MTDPRPTPVPGDLDPLARPVDLDAAEKWFKNGYGPVTEAFAMTLINEVRRLRGEAPAFDFRAHLERQAAFSAKTFGPGTRIKGVTDHIRKELAEVEKSNGSLDEWIDVVILALDGCWRSGVSPDEIIAAMVHKQTKNEARTWPDWRTADPNKAIEHDRRGEAPGPDLDAQATLEEYEAAVALSAAGTATSHVQYVHARNKLLRRLSGGTDEGALAVLKSVEWNGGSAGLNCPSCGGFQEYSHTEKCRLNKLLTAAPGEAPAPAPAPAPGPEEGEDARNRYGVNMEYFHREIGALLRSLPDRPPAELARYLRTLADVAAPAGEEGKDGSALAERKWPDDVLYLGKEIKPFTELLSEFQCTHYEKAPNRDCRCKLCKRYGRLPWDLFLPPCEDPYHRAMEAKRRAVTLGLATAAPSPAVDLLREFLATESKKYREPRAVTCYEETEGVLERFEEWMGSRATAPSPDLREAVALHLYARSHGWGIAEGVGHLSERLQAFWRGEADRVIALIRGGSPEAGSQEGGAASCDAL